MAPLMTNRTSPIRRTTMLNNYTLNRFNRLEVVGAVTVTALLAYWYGRSIYQERLEKGVV